jgi:hypothetical protein
MKPKIGRATLACVIASFLLTAAARAEDKGTFWELVGLGKPDLKVVTDPWPARAGAATLKAEITPDDDDQKFSGTLEFRVSSKEKNSDAWKPMKQTRQDKDGSTYFESPRLTLGKGSWYVQFRVRSHGTTLELTDWNVIVK